TMNLAGIVQPCPSGSGTLNLFGATLNATGDNFSSIQTNLVGDGSTINLTGNGPLNILAAGGFLPSPGIGRSVAHLCACTSLTLGSSNDLFQSGGFTTDGLGTT